MKKNWMKKLSAAICAATLFASGFAVTANAEPTLGYEFTPFGPKQFADLTGLPMTEKTTGSITVQKYITEQLNPESGEGSQTKNVPVNNVYFTLVKVGQYANVVAPDGTASTMIGMDKKFVDIVLAGDYSFFQPYIEDENGYVYMTSALYNSFNKAMEDRGNELVDDLTHPESEWYKGLSDNDKTTKATGSDGTNGEVTFNYKIDDFGIYVVMETDVLDAKRQNPLTGKWENALFAKKQYPYIVSLPYTTQPTEETPATWNTAVTAKAKNTETFIDVDKKIERNSNTLTGKMANQAETDVTHVGDIVEFTLITDVPMIEAHEGVESYVITDEVTKGITLPAAFTAGNIVITDSFHVDESGNPTYTYEFGKDYRVVKYADGSGCTDVDKVDYVDGFTIEFTESGRAKIAEAAHVTNGNQKIYTNYIATVNKDAVVGSEGNYNHVKLDLRAAGSGTITTGWEYVKEFIFSMEGNKTFDGNFSEKDDASKAEAVKFELYLNANGKDQPVSLIPVTDSTGAVIKGSYIYNNEATGTDAKATEITLDEKGSFSIKGIPAMNEDTSTNHDVLYLKETSTAPGYNKLTKVIPITLTATANGTTSEYDGTLASGTVNGKVVTPIKVNGEGVAVSASETGSNSGISFTVNNTKGFQLPSTGGMGIWMFVIGGMAVIGCGLLYYRRNKSAE